MSGEAKQVGIPERAVGVRLRIRPDQLGWVLEVGKERRFQGSPVGFSWKRWGYYNRLEGAVEDGLDAALHEGGDYEGMQELRGALGGALEEVRRLVEGLHQPKKS